jgi:hypothetical protein
MIAIILLIVFQIYSCDAWSGIVMDGDYGKTQLYVPGNPPINTPNVNFGLSHRVWQAAVMLYGKAYFIGGGIPTTNAVTIFNPSTNISAMGAPLNVARGSHAATVVGDTIIVCGGENSSTTLSSCEQYNPSTQNWTMITSLPIPFRFFVMVTLNNSVYTFGGSGDYICTSGSPPPVYMLDGQNWESRTSIAGLPNYNHAGVAIDADRALICGGNAYKGEYSCPTVSDCFIYSATNDSWTQAASMAQKRCWHSMVMFEGEREQKTVLKSCNNKITDQIYIFGNGCGFDQTAVELYSPSTGGIILSTRVVGDYSIPAVSIGLFSIWLTDFVTLSIVFWHSCLL